MRRLISASAASLALFAIAMPSQAHDHPALPSLEAVLDSDLRGDDGERDKYRHPAETLNFFQVEPTQTVIEWGPGGGWYTRVLAPWISPKGTYIAINDDSAAREYPNRSARARAMGWTERFKETYAEALAIEPEAINAYEIDEVPEEMEGTADRVLIFRSIHGLSNRNIADSTLRSLRSLLKDDGMVGVVQHRAPADAGWGDVNPAPGYMRQADVVKLFELNGFELVASSELNANPKDPANWEGGVWTLPPVLRYGETDRAKYVAIGESDRMTLLFKKAD